MSGDALTAAQLVAAALDAPAESDERWHAIHMLHQRNDGDAFDAACALAQDDDAARRVLGVDILAQLGAGLDDDQRPFRKPTVDLLLALLATERDVPVLCSIGVAFGHLGDERAIAPLAAMADHDDEDVRHSVVFGLLGHDDDLAVETLIRLSADPDCDVRDWATFGLGSQIERDTPEIRAALVARLDDPGADTAEEAVAGLAARGDARAIEPLLAQLQEYEGPLLDEALLQLAATFGDARLCRHVAARWSARADSDAAGSSGDVGGWDAELLRAAAQRCGLAVDLADGSEPHA